VDDDGLVRQVGHGADQFGHPPVLGRNLGELAVDLLAAALDLGLAVEQQGDHGALDLTHVVAGGQQQQWQGARAGLLQGQRRGILRQDDGGSPGLHSLAHDQRIAVRDRQVALQRSKNDQFPPVERLGADFLGVDQSSPGDGAVEGILAGQDGRADRQGQLADFLDGDARRSCRGIGHNWQSPIWAEYTSINCTANNE